MDKFTNVGKMMELMREKYNEKFEEEDPSADFQEGFAMAIRLIENAPAADVVEVRHGRWILGRVEPGYCTPGGNKPWICSECGKVASWSLNKPTKKWCDECGAKMDKEE